ncbi:hypothetical protein SI65_09723 [Aspergillus cristatus]|uniref:Uncharacterized protein n=1 Tax=Aspergillus cristatus TaxID=573508 RepID=A0A1E3B2B3_ASPCR|nr:hypothetical protein SI65_09723 [Aspergillus cristatus]
MKPGQPNILRSIQARPTIHPPCRLILLDDSSLATRICLPILLHEQPRRSHAPKNLRKHILLHKHRRTPEYREILKPDYEPGCKRRINTATYLASLHSPQTHLTKDSVAKIGANHIETADGYRYPVDAIIYATGFQTQKWLSPIQIKGVNGKDLHSIWDAAGGAEAYKGTVVCRFLNFFILYGPNAGTGQHSVIFHSECQINFTCRLLRPVLARSSEMIMVKPEAQRRDLSWVHGKLQHLVFNSGCQSWWMDLFTQILCGSTGFGRSSRAGRILCCVGWLQEWVLLSSFLDYSCSCWGGGFCCEFVIGGC